MKFTDGFWSIKPQVSVISPMRVVDVRTQPEMTEVFCAVSSADARSASVNGPMITYAFTSPMPDILTVKAYHFKGAADHGPHFETVNQNSAVGVTVGEETICVTAGRTSAVITRNPFSIVYYYGSRLLTGSPTKGCGYIQTPEGCFMREQLSLDVGECIYGLGERFTAFVKNGQSVDLWNEDGGTCSDLAYKNVPFYTSNRGYGIFIQECGRVSLEVASEVVSRVQFSIGAQSLTYSVIGGENLKSVLCNYAALTGRPALPPAWTFGLWLTTSFTTDYDEASVTEMIDGMAAREIPLSVFHYDCFWMKQYEWCNFTWDPQYFPEPAQMLARLKEKGLKICCWINPYIAQKSPLFDEAMQNGYLLMCPDGSVFQWDRWQAGMGLVDFTNPDACAWYQQKLAVLLDMGVDCFKTDFGERIPTQVVYFNGADPVRMHNYYTYLYNKTVFDLLTQKRGEGEACLFARSATAGCQQFPVHWGGDSSSNYPSMAETLRGGLSLAMSGFGFWSHDISGFESTATPDVYKRWCAFGLLSTHSRLHGSKSYRVPWLFDEESVEVLRYFTRLKCRLMPYLFGQSCLCASTGLPVMRPMVLEFGGDPACDTLERQYMLGDSLLIAPIFRPDGYVEYYLPQGVWTHLLSNETHTGGRWYRERYDYLSLPIFVRENTILPFGAREDSAVYDYTDHLELHVFALTEGTPAQTTIFDASGKQVLSVTITQKEKKLSIRVSSRVNDLSFVFRNVFDTTLFEGAANVEITELGVLVHA